MFEFRATVLFCCLSVVLFGQLMGIVRVVQFFYSLRPFTQSSPRMLLSCEEEWVTRLKRARVEMNSFSPCTRTFFIISQHPPPPSHYISFDLSPQLSVPKCPCDQFDESENMDKVIWLRKFTSQVIIIIIFRTHSFRRDSNQEIGRPFRVTRVTLVLLHLILRNRRYPSSLEFIMPQWTVIQQLNKIMWLKVLFCQ